MKRMAMELINPYLEEYESLYHEGSNTYQQLINLLNQEPDEEDISPYSLSSTINLVSRYEYRQELVSKYSFAIPNQEAISCIAKYSPIIEIGAGTGYWGYLIQQVGGDIVCIDKHPVNLSVNLSSKSIEFNEEDNNYFRFNTSWIDVQQGTESSIQQYPNRTLFLCWPSYEEPIASNCLKVYEGEYLIYIGEAYGGCCADDSFFELLDTEWENIESIRIPQWDGVHDYLFVYKRNN